MENTKDAITGKLIMKKKEKTFRLRKNAACGVILSILFGKRLWWKRLPNGDSSGNSNFACEDNNPVVEDNNPVEDNPFEDNPFVEDFSNFTCSHRPDL